MPGNQARALQRRHFALDALTGNIEMLGDIGLGDRKADKRAAVEIMRAAMLHQIFEHQCDALGQTIRRAQLAAGQLAPDQSAAWWHHPRGDLAAVPPR